CAKAPFEDDYGFYYTWSYFDLW
nr:immunoglobulin heavy chain junction region [Macaca mulatta]MOV53365.1 immunoglobulin heavy chain junction region [Macaca mulatta]MOV53420.1 immunoglobulin heavy chain junction region [Macaca mulatta]MOV53473.1 immunoglobulin heavy chain junction region [Macaca mulatta]MOV53768.1 immunoglobulin heavy chain junction region [Macaca mulatta]